MLAVSVVVLLVLATGAWLVLTGLDARRQLEVARGNLEAARSALLAQDVAAAREAIVAAGGSTAAARKGTHDPLWRVAGSVPLLGRSLRTTSGLTAAADDVARSVLPEALRAAELVDPDALRRDDGSIDLQPLNAARAPLASAAGRSEQVEARLSALPSRGVLPQVRTALSNLRGEANRLTSGLRGAGTALQLAPPLLGADRPRRYFVLIQQTSESRGTGGLPGGFAVLTADKGRVEVTAQGSNVDLLNGPIAPPRGVPQDFVDLYAPQGALSLWVNVNLSPDLPVVSRVVAERWRRQSGETVDGVIALDSTALQSLLQGSGPIALPGGRQLPPDQVVRYLAVQQYLDFAPPTGATGIDRSAERKESLRRIARAATARLTGGGGDDAALLRGLGEAVRSGHLRMASDDPALQELLRASGRSGGLPSGSAPVAYPVVYNSTGGKLDYFLDRRVRYSAGPCQGPRRRSRIVVELRNSVPAGGLPPYLTTRIEGGRVGSSLSNAVTLQVYGTRGALLEAATLDGQPLGTGALGAAGVLRTSSEAGLPLWSTLVELPKDKTRRLQLDLVEPVVAGEARVPEQPLARPLDRSVAVPAC